jgi:CRISPR-associated protein (Cas_Cas02710)
LIGSKDSESYFKTIKQASAKYFPGVKIHELITVGEVYGEIDQVYDAVRGIFDKCHNTSGVAPHRIITDITGGTKIMSIALTLACVDANREIQYLDQKDRKTFRGIKITRETTHRRPK